MNTVEESLIVSSDIQPPIQRNPLSSPDSTTLSLHHPFIIFAPLPTPLQKRTADETAADDKPVSKKSKPSSTAAKPKSTTKVNADANGNGVEPSAKPASKAAAKPASKASKPASTAKPKSAAPKSKKKDEKEAAIEEEKEAEADKDEKPTTGGAKELGLGDKLPKIVLQ
jgi:hypothetical protein